MLAIHQSPPWSGDSFFSTNFLLWWWQCLGLTCVFGITGLVLWYGKPVSQNLSSWAFFFFFFELLDCVLDEFWRRERSNSVQFDFVNFASLLSDPKTTDSYWLIGNWHALMVIRQCAFLRNELPKMFSDVGICLKKNNNKITAVLSLSHFSPHTQILKELVRVEVEIYIVACDRKCECTDYFCYN